VPGKPGQFDVLADGQKVAGKDGWRWPDPDDVVAAILEQRP
jgi:hypothetical protein